MGLASIRLTDRAAPLRVLVVDDEPQVCELVKVVLETAGYKVRTASSGPEAIAIVEIEGPPDLLLTDFKMPQMDGDALAAKLRHSAPDLKVLYLTGYSDGLFDNRGTLWEGEAFLEKPSTPAALLEGVAMLLFNHVSTAAASGPPLSFQMRALLGDLPKNPRKDVV